PAIGTEQRAGGAWPEMLLNVLGVELQSCQLGRTRDHPEESVVRQTGLSVAASDIRVGARKPDLLHALPVLARFVDPGRCRERAAPLIDRHGMQAILDVLADLPVAEAAR